MTGLVGPLRVTPRGELAHASQTAMLREHVRAVLLTQARPAVTMLLFLVK